MQEIESGEPAELEIEAPPGLLPDLSEWGIEEIERGVCEDTSENRAVIRKNKAQCRTVFDSNGMPTGYIQVISAEMYQAAQALSKTSLLSDPDDYNSDFLSGLKLLMAEDAKSITPTWVIRTTQTYIKQQEQRRSLGQDAELLQSRLVAVPTRCNVTKADGTRCWGWSNGASEMAGMCRIHARRASRSPVQAMSTAQMMRNRLQSGAPDMLERLAVLAESEDERIASTAIRDWLDRAGYKAVDYSEQKVEVVHTDAADTVRDRLKKLRQGQEDKAKLLQQLREQHAGNNADVIDAEVIEDE